MAQAGRAMRVRNKMAGARLRALRERFDLSPEEVGQVLELTAEEVLAREVGAEPLGVQELWRLCHYLGVELPDAYVAQAEPDGRILGVREVRLRRKLLGATMAERREERGLSREEAAREAGVQEKWLLQVEQGEADAALAAVEALSRVYGCAPESLLSADGAGDVQPPPRRPAQPTPDELPTDVAEFLRQPEAERYVRAAMALRALEPSAVAALEDMLLFLRGG